MKTLPFCSGLNVLSCPLLCKLKSENIMEMDAWLIWFLIAVGFFLLEFVIPGVVLVFFSLGSLVTMLTTLVGWTDTFTSQLVVCAIASVVTLVVLRSTIKKWFEKGADEVKVEDEFVGHHVKVVETIPGGNTPGKVEHKGAGWNAISDREIEKGATVEIVAIDGITLSVK